MVNLAFLFRFSYKTIEVVRRDVVRCDTARPTYNGVAAIVFEIVVHKQLWFTFRSDLCLLCGVRLHVTNLQGN